MRSLEKGSPSRNWAMQSQGRPETSKTKPYDTFAQHNLGQWEVLGDQLEWHEFKHELASQSSCLPEASAAHSGRTLCLSCVLAGSSVCAWGCYTGSKGQSSNLTGQTWKNLPKLSAPQKMESEQKLKGVIPTSLLPRCLADPRASPGWV